MINNYYYKIFSEKNLVLKLDSLSKHKNSTLKAAKFVCYKSINRKSFAYPYHITSNFVLRIKERR